MCFGCSKEPSQMVLLSTHNIMFWSRDKRNNFKRRFFKHIYYESMGANDQQGMANFDPHY